MKKLMLAGLCCLFLSGCFAVDGPKVVIVDNSLQPAQITDTNAIEVRYIDPATGKEVIKKEVRQGHYVLTPSTYKGLINSAMNNNPAPSK